VSWEKALKYIDAYWNRVYFHLPEDKGVHIGLPNPAISPNDKIFHNDQFYWDTYFTILGLLDSGKVDLAKGMVENLFYLYRRFNIIPMRNRFYNLGISQPPFLTSMILEVYEKTQDKDWLSRVAKIAEKELQKYWMNDYVVEKHLVFDGLSRYCDHHITHATAEHESGWDMTSRFYGRCLDFLPIDLNTLLYKYEVDLSKIYTLLNNPSKSEYYRKNAETRKEKIFKYMWDERKGFFFDYDWVNQRRSKFWSVAGFYPLWAKMVDDEMAAQLVKNLRRFEKKGGLVNTQPVRSKVFKQWDYPNGWPNQQWIVVKGLLNYGYVEDAFRITSKWLEMNLEIFEETGNFWEKYDVVKYTIGKSGRYPTQSGFSWTNSIFIRLYNLLNVQQL
jgi:alpha,alpha-trehalase